MTAQRFREIITPTPVQALGFPLATLLVLVIVFRDDLARRIFPPVLFETSLSQPDYAGRLLGHLDTPLVHSLVIIIFWSLIGLIAYTLVWGLSNVMVDARNQVVIETGYVNKGSVHQRIQTAAWRVAWIVVFFASLFVSAYVLLPLWVGLFGQAIFEARIDALTVGQAVASILGAAANSYVLVLIGSAVLDRAN